MESCFYSVLMYSSKSVSVHLVALVRSRGLSNTEESGWKGNSHKVAAVDIISEKA